MTTATVTAPNGDQWTLDYTSSKQRPRTGLGKGGGADCSRYNRGLIRSYANGADTTECILCGNVIGTAAGTTLDVAGMTVVLDGAEADRVAQGLEGWTIDTPSGQFPYHPATVAPACRTCNGDPSARAAYGDRLDTVARALLDAHAA